MRRNLNRRGFLRLSTGMTASALLAACGGGTEQTAQPTTGTTGTGAATSVPPANSAATSVPAAATAPAGAATGAGTGKLAYQGTVEFWDWAAAGDARYEAMTKLIADWQTENPGITLDYKSFGYDDMQTKLLTAASAGEGPPFSNIHNYWRIELQRSNLLAPYPDDMFAWDQMISTPFNRDARTGKVYTTPFAHYTDQVYFNQNLLDKQGIPATQVPRKWDDFMKLAQQLTVRDNGGKVTQAGWSLNHYYSREWLWATLVYQLGGYLWSEDGTQALWNSDQGVQAMQFIQDVYHKHKVDDADFLGMFDAWGAQTAAMYVSQGYTGSNMDANYPDFAGKWGTAVTPLFGDKPSPAWGLLTPEEGFGVFTSAPPDVQQVGFSFIRKMMGGDADRVRWALISNGPPDDQRLFNDATLKAEDAKRGNSIATQAETLPYRINYGERPLEAEKVWRTAFDQVILEQADVKTVMNEANDQMNAALKQSGKQRLFTERNYKPPTS